MKRLVVDASVVIKWFVPEIHAHNALHLLTKEIELLAPQLISAEVGNILWKKWRLGELDADAARGIIVDFKRSPLQIQNPDNLLEEAWAIAGLYRRSFYDSLYLALAKTHGCRFVTADLKLFNSLKDGHLGKTIMWVEDVL